MFGFFKKKERPKFEIWSDYILAINSDKLCVTETDACRNRVGKDYFSILHSINIFALLEEAGYHVYKIEDKGYE